MSGELEQELARQIMRTGQLQQKVRTAAEGLNVQSARLSEFMDQDDRESKTFTLERTVGMVTITNDMMARVYKVYETARLGLMSAVSQYEMDRRNVEDSEGR